jgi:uridine kinase
LRGDKLLIKPHHRRAASGLSGLLRDRLSDVPARYVITIAGESGTGKSETAEALRAELQSAAIPSVVLQQDDYFLYPPRTNDQKRRQDIQWVGMNEVGLDLMDRNLARFKEGCAEIEKPLVVFSEDRIDRETLDVRRARLAIAEGTYTTALKNADLRVFIDIDYTRTRGARVERARDRLDPFLESVLQIEHRIISAHKSRADLIIGPDYEVRWNED